MTLDRLLAGVRLSSAFYFSVTARMPWATLTPHTRNIGHIVMPQAARVLPFHIMLSGNASAWITTRPDTRQDFRTGDILLLPRGHDHVIASVPTSALPPETDTTIYAEAAKSGRPCTFVEIGGSGVRSDFVCGYLGLPETVFLPIVDHLPDLVVLSPSPQKWQTLQDLVRIATREQENRNNGGDRLATRLAEAMFVDALGRVALSQGETAAGLFSGLGDRRIASALRAIHDEPAAGWTVETLAAEAGMSRSSFAARFRTRVGISPSRHLQNLRMQIAASGLADPDTSIQRVVERVGYQSEAAFNRAFRRTTGTSPSEWRNRRKGTGQRPGG